jgi:regulator of nucleoside diphosphate kinase
MSNEESLPPITVTHEDLAVLHEVVRRALAEGRYAAASRLGNELHRARVVRSSEVPANCLTLNVFGRYLDEHSGAVRDVVLVSGRGRPAVGAVPVLSRVGTALIGLSAGQRIGWRDSLGRTRATRLLSVQPSGTAG